MIDSKDILYSKSIETKLANVKIVEKYSGENLGGILEAKANVEVYEMKGKMLFLRGNSLNANVSVKVQTS